MSAAADEPALHREIHGSRAICCSQFREYMRDVVVDGAPSDRQAIRDLVIREAFREEP